MGGVEFGFWFWGVLLGGSGGCWDYGTMNDEMRMDERIERCTPDP